LLFWIHGTQEFIDKTTIEEMAAIEQFEAEQQEYILTESQYTELKATFRSVLHVLLYIVK
jgi:hypothetical protein